MTLHYRTGYFILVLALSSFNVSEMIAQDSRQMVRLAVIEVDPTQLNQYNSFLKEEIDASIKKEPGVITLYAVAEKENPERVILFETYADTGSYKTHLTTPHFQKYKQGTLKMVTHLDLIEMRSILYHKKDELSKVKSENLYIRLIKMEIDSTAIADFRHLADNVMLPGLKTEPGVLVIYAVAEKNHPIRISILEVYKNVDAYKRHITSTHFLRYKEESGRMVKSLELIDVDPILLGLKP